MLRTSLPARNPQNLSAYVSQEIRRFEIRKAFAPAKNMHLKKTPFALEFALYLAILSSHVMAS